MGQADIGVNVFLIDSFTSPMGLITGAMGLFATSLMSSMNAQQAAGDAMQALTEKYNAQQLALAELTLDEDMYNTQLAANLITQDEYDVAMSDNAVAQQAAMASIDETTASLEAQQIAYQDAGAAATDMGAALGGGVALLVFGGALLDATKQAGNLQDELAKLAVAGNLNGQQMQKLSGFLYDLAGNSMFAATDVAQGFTLMMGKGATATDIMNHLGQAMVNLAEATGQSGTSGAATLLSSVLQIFNLKATDAKNVTDALTYAFYHGGQSIDSLQSAYSAVGPIAHAMGVTFSEVTANLVTLTQAGLTASQAGTAMRYELSSMYEPTQKQANELEFLGIVTANKATPAFEKFLSTMNAASGKLKSNSMSFDGTINGLYEIFKNAQKVGTVPMSDTFLQWADSIGMVNNKFYTANGQIKTFTQNQETLIKSIESHSKTPQQFSDAMAQMFNVRSGQAMAILLSHTQGLTANEKNLALAMENQGLAAEDAQKRMSTMPSQMTALGTTFQHFMGIVGLPFAQGIQNIAGAINTFISGIIDKHPAIMGILGVVMAVGAAAGAVVLVAGVLTLLGTAIGAISLPLILVVGGIALLAAGIGLLVHWIQSSKPAMNEFHKIMYIIGGIVGALANLFMSQMKPALAQLQDAWKQLWTQIQPILPVLLMVGKILLVLAVGVIIAIVVGAIFTLRAAIWVLSMVLYGIGHAIQSTGIMFSGLGTIAHNVASGMTTAWNNATHIIGNLFATIGMLIHNLISGAENWGLNFILMFVNGIMSGIGNVKNAVSTVANTVKSFLGFHSPTKEGPGSEAHTWMPNMMNMFVQGIVSGTPQLSAAAHGAALGIRGAFTSPSITSAQGLNASSGSGSASGPGTINFCVDGKVYTQVAVQGLTKQIAATGIQKVLR